MKRSSCLIFLACVWSGCFTLPDTFFLENTCGNNSEHIISQGTKFNFRAGKGSSPTCQGSLTVRWETPQLLWVRVSVRKFVIAVDSASRDIGGCNELHSLQLISHDGSRSITGPSEFSFRVSSTIQLQYYRLMKTANETELDMSISIEPFNISSRAEYYNQNHYHNVSFEEYCGQKIYENVSDGSIRWLLNIKSPDVKADSHCLMSFNFHTTNQTEAYFLAVDLLQSELTEKFIPLHGCLIEQQIFFAGPGWLYSMNPDRTSSVLMRLTGVTTIGYSRKAPYNETSTLDMMIRINEGNEFVTDINYSEEPELTTVPDQSLTEATQKL